jgi:predicted Rossmann fold nucleotide-binding protein DprA/Smf involved in DNA uptake
MNIGIVGWRHFVDYELFKKLLDNLISPGCTIISGGCTGADTLAEKYADEFKLEKKIYLPDIKKGAGRFHARNRQIVNDSHLLIAFVHPESKGTLHSIELAKKKGIQVVVYNVLDYSK